MTAVARVKAEVAEDLRRAGLVASIGPDRIYPTLPTAVEAYRAWCREQQSEGDDS